MNKTSPRAIDAATAAAIITAVGDGRHGARRQRPRPPPRPPRLPATSASTSSTARPLLPDDFATALVGIPACGARRRWHDPDLTVGAWRGALLLDAGPGLGAAVGTPTPSCRAWLRATGGSLPVGLTPDNIGRAIAAANPWGVDTSTVSSRRRASRTTTRSAPSSVPPERPGHHGRMKLYADTPARRSRQIFGDLWVVAWDVFSVWLACWSSTT